jgi:hypothetical protein
LWRGQAAPPPGAQLTVHQVDRARCFGPFAGDGCRSPAVEPAWRSVGVRVTLLHGAEGQRR